MLEIKISIVICTHNRADFLPGLLETLAQQTLGHAHYEILVVDNASTDSTREVIEEFISHIPDLGYVFEQEIGLSHARNRGWEKARGEYVAYVDDDCRIPSDWLSKTMTIATEKAPLAFGGPYLPFYLSPKQKWYKDAYGSFMEGQYQTTAGHADNFNLCGGNFIVQRQVLELLGGFNPQLGMTGTTIAYAEEDELQNRIRQRWAQGLIYFDPQLVIHHLVAERKMHLPWRIRQQFQRGKSLAILHAEQFTPVNWWHASIKFVKIFSRIIYSLLRGLIARDKKRFPYCFQWIYEDTALYFAHLGVLMESFSRRIANHD